jgi:hypothetical protein
MISKVTEEVMQENGGPTTGSFHQKWVTVASSFIAAIEHHGQSFQNNEIGRDISELLNTDQQIAGPPTVHDIRETSFQEGISQVIQGYPKAKN